MCLVCKTSSSDAKELEKHFGNHDSSEISRFPCHLCKLKFLKFATLERHQQLVHLKRSSCVVNRYFNELNQLREESRNTSEEQKEVSADNDEADGLFKDEDSCEGESLSGTKDLEIYKCSFDECQKTFKYQTSLIMHGRCVHSDERPFICDICSKTFKTRSNLNVHIKMHNNQRNHPCKICDQSFFTSSHLKAHVKVHLKDAKYKCSVLDCGKMFIHQSSFKKHQNFHSGVKNHHCTICQRYFAQVCHLREHLKIHTNERNHKCQLCEKTFRRADTLRIHKRIHDS